MTRGIGILAVLLVGATLAGCSAQSAKEQVQQQVDNAKQLAQAAFTNPQVSDPAQDPRNQQQAQERAAQFVLYYCNWDYWRTGPSDVPGIEYVNPARVSEFRANAKKDYESMKQEFGNDLPVLQNITLQDFKIGHRTVNGQSQFGYFITFDLHYKPNPKPIENHTATVLMVHTDDHGWVVDGFNWRVGK